MKLWKGVKDFKKESTRVEDFNEQTIGMIVFNEESNGVEELNEESAGGAGVLDGERVDVEEFKKYTAP